MELECKGRHGIRGKIGDGNCTIMSCLCALFTYFLVYLRVFFVFLKRQLDVVVGYYAERLN